MELYAAAGMELVRELTGAGTQVFLDMKFYDIGETVKRAVAQVAKSGVRFLTVHGSKAVMQAAVEGRGDAGLQLLAVTVLTSFDQADLADLGYPCSVIDLVTFGFAMRWRPEWTVWCALGSKWRLSGRSRARRRSWLRRACDPPERQAAIKSARPPPWRRCETEPITSSSAGK